MQYLSSATVSPGACSVSRSSMRNRSPPTARPPPPPPPPPPPLPRRDEDEDDEDVLVTEGHIHRRPRLDAAPETLTSRRSRAGQKRQDKNRKTSEDNKDERCAHNVLCDEDGTEGSVHCSRSGHDEECFTKEASLGDTSMHSFSGYNQRHEVLTWIQQLTAPHPELNPPHLPLWRLQQVRKLRP